MNYKFLIFLSILGLLVATFKLKILIFALKIFRLKIVYAFIIPLILVLIWFTLSIREVYKSDNVFLQLTSHYSKQDLHDPNFQELTQYHKISGTFTAQNDYMGIVAVRFWNFYRLNDDFIIFRIKERGNPHWFYEAKVKVDQFQPHGLFPFGFPIINDSQGKAYEFEIESTAGRAGNAIGLSPIEPIFITRYKYSKTFVTSSFQHLSGFVYQKFVSLLLTPSFVVSSLIYFLPVALYGIYFQSKVRKIYARIFVENLVSSMQNNVKKLNSDKKSDSVTPNKTTYKVIMFVSSLLGNLLKNDKSSRGISMFLVVLAIALDVFFVKREDSTVIILILSWVFLMVIYNIHLKKTYFVSFLLFIVAGICWYLGDVNLKFAAERALSWSFLFAAISAVHMTLDLFKARFQK